MGSSGAVSAVPPRLEVVAVLGGWWGPPPLPAPARRICGLAFPKTPGVGRPTPTIISLPFVIPCFATENSAFL